jgi:transposase-like protein
MNKTETPGKTRRRHRSAAEWQTLITAHERSGLSQEAFCKGEGVSAVSLSNWRKRLSTQGNDSRIEKTPSPTFIEIGNTMRPLDAGIKVRLELGSGIVLELSRT